jgi:5-methyltetrahydrofolate--homocysteine methyltransferase
MIERLKEELAKRIVILDGPRGTMIQRRKLTEEEFRGERLRDHPSDLRGNNDILNLTQPEIVSEIYEQYLDAGSDIIGTNTFNSSSISQADYGAEKYVYEINFESARQSLQRVNLQQ